MPALAEMTLRSQAARSEADRLAAYLAGLSAEGWNNPTACDLWQVADVAAHLVWIGEFYVSFITRSLAGDISPPPGSPKDEKYADLAPEAFYDLTAREYRQNLGPDLLSALVSRFAALNQLLESLTPADYDKTCFYHSGNRPLWTLADLTVQELAVHRWDIQSPQEPDAGLAPESQPVLLDRVTQRPQPVLDVGLAADQRARLRFQLSGMVERSYDFLLSAAATAILEPASINPASTEPVAATLSCDTETFILILYRRLKIASAMGDGRIDVSGDRDLAQKFAAAF